VQARQGDVGRRIRIVDREDVVASHERLARVELPAEEGVDELRDRHDLVSLFRREEVVSHLVAVVLRTLRLEPHDHRLRADRQRPREHVEAVDRPLHVHQLLPGRVVDAL
jgi:hypothetical protein